MEIHTQSHTAKKKKCLNMFFPSLSLQCIALALSAGEERLVSLSSHSESLSSCLPISPSHFSVSPVCPISQQASYCALHSFSWRISACEAELVSLSQMDVSRNCHSLHQLISRLSGGEKKGQRPTRTVQNARRSHVCTHIFAPPTKHLFISLLSLCVFTLAPTHSPCISSFTKIPATHIPIPKCCTQPSRWPLALIYV